MYLSMSDDEVEGTSGCRTAHEIWIKLNTMYESVSGESKQVLSGQKYYGIMASENKSPVKTMIEIQNYAAQLRSMGATIDDEMEVARVISSLMNEKFRQFREAWRSVDVTKQTTALLLSRLMTWELEEVESGKSNSLTEDTQAQKAFLVKKGKPKKTKEEIAESKKKWPCFICKKKGHWKSECPDKKNKEEADKKDKKEEDGRDKNTRAAYSVGATDDVWINDSGANRHYCGRMDWLTQTSRDCRQLAHASGRGWKSESKGPNPTPVA
jgi:hypothetical protein